MFSVKDIYAVNRPTTTRVDVDAKLMTHGSATGCTKTRHICDKPLMRGRTEQEKETWKNDVSGLNLAHRLLDW